MPTSEMTDAFTAAMECIDLLRGPCDNPLGVRAAAVHNFKALAIMIGRGDAIPTDLPRIRIEH